MGSAQSANTFIGFAPQTVDMRTAAVSGFSYLRMKAGGLTMERPSKASDELYGYEPQLMRGQNLNAAGTIPILLYFNQIAQWLGNFLKHVSGTELASYTVTAGVNDKIDFEIGGGAVVATVAPGTYTTTTLATAVIAALNAAAAGTYTMPYSTSTKKFTLTKSAGTFTINWATGPNAATSIKSLIGFTANDTGALSYLADSQAPAVYTHVFEPDPTAQFSGNQDNGLTLIENLDILAKEAVGCQVVGFAIAYAENDPHAPALNITIKGCTLDHVAAVSPTFATDVPAKPQGNVTMTLVANGHTHTAHYFKSLTVTITPAVDLRWTVGDEEAVAVIHTGKIGYTVNWAWDLEDRATGGGANYQTDHKTVWQDPEDTVSMTVTHLGETLRGAVRESLVIALRALRPTGATPVSQAGTIEAPYNYSGQYDNVNGQAGLHIELISNEVWV